VRHEIDGIEGAFTLDVFGQKIEATVRAYWDYDDCPVDMDFESEEGRAG